jgi:hypothetical protein
VKQDAEIREVTHYFYQRIGGHEFSVRIKLNGGFFAKRHQQLEITNQVANQKQTQE